MRTSWTLVIATAWLAACGDGGLGGGGGDDCASLLGVPADGLSLELSTSERSASRYAMLVGEVGRPRASISAGGVDIGSPATFRSSDPSVVRLGHDASSVTLAAVGAGSATITAEGCGLSAQVPVQVSAAPLPIDALVVNALVLSDWPGSATKEPNGNLLSLTLAVGEITPLDVFAMRAGEWVFGGALLPVLASSNTAVAEILSNCRPPEVDPGCSVYSDAWVVARSVGSAEMSVTVRNLTWHFQVQVTAP